MGKIQLTKEQAGQIAAGALFSALFIYVYAVYFWLPISAKIETNSKSVASMESDISKAKAQKAKYKDLELKLASLKAEKEAAQKRLPKERKLPDLLKTLTLLSKKYKVELQGITPGGKMKGEYFDKAAYQISAKGDYHALGRFLTALGLEERILTMENLVLSATPGAATSATATFTLLAYQYNG
ncbi:MAG: type 4a pilus biogenesis protein PilO [Elusimicrobiales bacterium]|jgi:type IV pilus assembly protein PilO